MEYLMSVISKVEQATALNAKAADGDYQQDGLLYCGKCHTPKQHRGKFLGFERIVPCICKCKKAELEAEERQEQWEALQKRIKQQRFNGFPESDMQKWSFENAESCKIVDVARRYVENFQQFKANGKGLLLYGGVGTGKTFVAACIVNALIDTCTPCLMTNFARVLNTLWSNEEKQAYIDSFNQFDLLVLDDLGAERRSEYAQEQVFNIIDSRYRARLPLIITTNLSLKELTNPDNAGNGRIYDRVLEMCHPVKVEGESRRRKKVMSDFKAMNELLGL